MEPRFTEALALIGGPIDEHFGTDDVAEGQEHLHQLGIAKLLRQVVDEQVAALGSRNRTPWKEKQAAIYVTKREK